MTTDQVAELWSFPTNPAEFDADERISFSKLDRKFIAVQEDGTEFEFDAGLKRWIPTIDEALLEEYQAAYAPPSTTTAAGEDGNGVNNNANSSSSGSGNAGRKRKQHQQGDDASGSGSGNKRASKRRATEGAAPARQNTAIYVTGLPADATLEEVAELFSRKCGVIAEEIDGNRPRIKMYADAEGNFKGDALIVFFKPQSVDMAIMLLDDTNFRLTASGVSGGRIRVQAADASYKKTNYEQAAGDGGGVRSSEPNGGSRSSSSGGAASSSSAAAPGRPQQQQQQQQPQAQQRSAADKHKIIKKTQKLDARLADWDDDDPRYVLAPAASDTDPATSSSSSSKDQRVVILRHMFTLAELAEDPAALLDIKEDVRDECEKLGDVTNVVLYDMEEDGIVSVRFRRAEAADACVRLMHGRSFGGRVVEARKGTGKEKFRRSKARDDAEDGDP